MPVFKYTLKKFLRLKSMWIITLIAFGAVFLFMGVLIFGNLIDYKTVSVNIYVAITNTIYAGMATIFALIGSIFTGFIGSKVFKDEVEDGTFLIILSKPQSRGRIILEKWIAYFVVIVIFVLMATLGLIFGAIFFDKPVAGSEIIPYAARNNLFKIFIINFSIGLVVVTIFSSISLLLSTKFSTGGTIGMVVALGVAMPVTGMIGTFANKVGYNTSFTSGEEQDAEQVEQLLRAYGYNNQLIKPTSITIPGIGKVHIKTISDLSKVMVSMRHGIQDEYISDLGISNGKAVSYNYLVFLDLNYQIQRLGSISESALAPKAVIDKAQASQAATGNGKAPTTSKQVVKKTLNKSDASKLLGGITGMSNKVEKQIQNILKPPAQHKGSDPVKDVFKLTSFIDSGKLEDDAKESLSISQKQTLNDILNSKTGTSDEKLAKGLEFVASTGKLKQLEYKDYINKYGVLAVYIILASIMVPLSYWVVRNQDFR